MSQARPFLGIKQAEIRQRMKACGYSNVDEKGMCCGIANMARQALLVGEIDYFDQRIIDICDIPLESFNEKLAELKELELKKLELKELARLKKGKAKKDNVGKPSLRYSDILAFFDGIEIYQHAYVYPQLFENTVITAKQTIDISAPFTLSKKLQKENGFALKHSFSGIYDRYDLLRYFKSLRETLSKTQLSPIALVLHSSNHVMTISYDIEKNQWLFIDPNRLPTRRFNDDGDIANQILYGFFSRGNVTFSTDISTIHSKENELNHTLDEWKKHADFKKIHQVSPEKTQLSDTYKASWLHVAATLPDVEIIDSLLENGADPNATTITKSTPLHFAVHYEKTAIIEKLLNHPHKAIIDLPDEIGITPLLYATVANTTEPVRILLAKGADPNIKDRDNKNTPLHWAIENKNHASTNILLNAGADTKEKNKAGLRPFDLAIKLHQDEIARDIAKKDLCDYITKLTERESEYLSKAGRLFGYSRQQKLVAAKALLEIAQKTSPNSLREYKEKLSHLKPYKKMLNNSELKIIYRDIKLSMFSSRKKEKLRDMDRLSHYF